MTPFRLQLKPGAPIYGQLLYAARMAIVSGELGEGEAFPSVRALSREYGINPNTVQKAINALKAEGLIEISPGIGARVCAAPKATRADRAKLLGPEMEALVLRARQLHLPEEEVIAALRSHWEKISPAID